MASPEEYAAWIVKNADKKGTPEFETVAKAYQASKAAPAPTPVPVSEGMPAERQIPAWGQENPNLYGAAQFTGNVVKPLLEVGGAMAGGAVGSLGGPLGTVLGAGGGYAAGKGVSRNIDVALGNEAPIPSVSEGMVTGAKDILAGASMEAGGRVVAPYVAKGAGWLYDTLAGQIGVQKAAKLMKEAFGTGIDAIRQTAKAAPQDLTAAQSVAGSVNPTAQALLERVSGRTPASAARTLNVAQAQEAARVNQLAGLAGAETQTGARGAQIESKNALNQQLIPVLKTELKAANTAGEMLPKFENDMQRNAYMAATKAEEAKFATGAAGKIGERYTTELKDLATKQATEAEAGVLTFEEAGRFAKQAADSLAAHGLNPLKSKSITASIDNVLKKPEFAGNREVETALSRVSKDVKDWTNAGGVIDAQALDSIRKNSVNSAVQALLPAADAKAQKALAAKLTAQIKPLIVDAIEAAGGTGYRGYLETYSKGMQAIGQKKLSGVALDMYQKDPQGFVRLVAGNSPKEVEKIFGPGSYDIAKEMSESAMKTLKSVAGEVVREGAIKTQSAAGQQAYRELLDASTGKLKFPSFFSAKTTAANAVLDKLENKLGKKVMDTLTNAAQSGKSLDALLSVTPAEERVKILKMLTDPSIVRATTVNTLAPEKRNNLGR